MDFCENPGESRDVNSRGILTLYWLSTLRADPAQCTPVHLSFARSGVVCSGRAVILEKPRRALLPLLLIPAYKNVIRLKHESAFPIALSGADSIAPISQRILNKDISRDCVPIQA